MIVENGAKIGLFFAWELKRLKRQLSSARSGWDNVNKKAKSISKLKFIAKAFDCFVTMFRLSQSMLRCCMTLTQYCRWLILILLLRGGIEPNPGPIQIVSQNCRGLTDRNKLRKVIRSIYPANRTKANSSRLACLQETHFIDSFTAGVVFNGKVIVDNGERNQKGVCILVPESFEVCSQVVSGIGRWVIAVIQTREDPGSVPRKMVVASVYAPNCHRESLGFFQEFFHAFDDVCDGLNQLNEVFDSVIAGDFNLVLNFSTGAVNRATSRTECELAILVEDAMNARDLIESDGLCKVNCYTWRRGTCLSKLDYMFLSRNLCSNIRKSSIVWNEFGAGLDHAAISVEIEYSACTTRGRSFPKLFKTDICKEVDKEWLKAQLHSCESQIPDHWDPHMKLDFVKTMIRSKTLELRQMNQFRDDLAAVRADINLIMAKGKISTNEALRLDALKVKLSELEDKEAEVMRIRAGVKWREEGEKSNSYFLARFKARTAGATMHSISLGQRVVKGSKEILSVVRAFYQRLYAEQNPAMLDNSEFCDNFFAQCPTLLPEQRQRLAGPLDLPELVRTLKSCADSAPGLDGIPYSFYSAFPDLLLKYVLDSWNYALLGNGLAESHRRSCITLLPKKGKDLTKIGNWRPISLSPCDLKIITKAYANRLKEILPSILCEAQAAYTPGRDISFNNRVLQSARNFALKRNLDFCLVSLDAQKAFDSVSHQYLVKLMEVYDFPPEFISVFQTLYRDLDSVVQVNGFISQQFAVQRGVKQGDALSCGLFVLAIDPLLRNILVNDHIEALTVPLSAAEAVEVKVLSYADDVAIICRNRRLQPIFAEYERFSQVSGLVLNADKTEVFNFTPSPNTASRIRYLGRNYELGRVNQIRVCGIWLASDQELEYKNNVMDKIMIMESMILGWGRRYLSMNGRMIIAKSFLLSQIVFPAQSVRIKKAEVKRIERLIYSFVNGAKNLYGPERVARVTLKAAKEEGGIGGVDVDSFIKAIVVKQFEKAERNHRTLGLFQALVNDPLDDISVDARAIMRNNIRTSADLFSIPDLGQLELISGTPLTSLLTPGSRAAAVAAEEMIDSMAALQDAFNDQRIARNLLTIIIRALPRPMAGLIRAGALIQAPRKLIWIGSTGIDLAERVLTKQINLSILRQKFPNMEVKLEKIYKRADWPPPGLNHESNFKFLWGIRNPTLRAIRLKIMYKDVFSNERRFRFNMVDSPSCGVCGLDETVEHQLFLCRNAVRIWDLYLKLTGVRITSLYEAICCGNNVVNEVIKSILIRSLLQINRSQDRRESEIIAECAFFLGIEARVNRGLALALQLAARRILTSI